MTFLEHSTQNIDQAQWDYISSLIIQKNYIYASDLFLTSQEFRIMTPEIAKYFESNGYEVCFIDSADNYFMQVV